MPWSQARTNNSFNGTLQRPISDREYRQWSMDSMIALRVRLCSKTESSRQVSPVQWMKNDKVRPMTARYTLNSRRSSPMSYACTEALPKCVVSLWGASQARLSTPPPIIVLRWGVLAPRCFHLYLAATPLISSTRTWCAVSARPVKKSSSQGSQTLC